MKNLKIDKTEARTVTQYLQKKCLTPEDMAQIHAEDSISCTTVKKIVCRIQAGLGLNRSDPRSSRRKTSTTDEEVDAIHCIVLNDRRLIVQLIAKSIGN